MHFRSAITRSSNQRRHRWIPVVVALVCASVGCRQRAFTEVYVENMAGEIRSLEDRIWEYDAEYQSLERQLEEMRRTNAELQRKLDLGAIDPAHARPSKPNSSSRTKPKSLPNSVLEIEPYDAPVVEMPVIEMPPRSSNGLKPSDATKGLKPEVLETPPSITRTPPPNSQNATNEAGSDKKPLVAPVEESIIPPQLKSDAKEETLSPPALLPPGFPTSRSRSDLDKKRILAPRLSPVQLASAVEPKRSTAIAPKPIDTVVKEIAFHTTRCRGLNYDSKPGDDGLYLVITPKNAAGESINASGTLIVVVEDSAIEANGGRVGRWEFTESELQDYLEPIGEAQGFHLQLPWQDVEPVSNSVRVYLRFSMRDGRTMTRDREIQLRRPTSAQSTWTPR